METLIHIAMAIVGIWLIWTTVQDFRNPKYTGPTRTVILCLGGCGVVLFYCFVDVCYGVQISNGDVADYVMEYIEPHEHKKEQKSKRKISALMYLIV